MTLITILRRAHGRHHESRGRHRDDGSVLLITFILVTVCGILIAGSLTYVSTVLRSHPAVEERSVAVESATSAMRAAILMQVAKGPAGCVDSAGLPAGTFDSNGMDTVVTCTVLESMDSSRNRYSVITTQTDASRRGLSGWLGTSAGGAAASALKDIDGDVFVNGGWLTNNTQDILVRGNSGNRYRIEYSNSTEAAPGVSPQRAPTAARYRIDDTVLDCDGAALGDDGYPTAASAITGQSYGHVTPVCSTSTEAPLSNGAAWWERAGDDLDPDNDDSTWHYPRLPSLPLYERDGRYVDLTSSCRLYYPGRYVDPITITGADREHYFTSGVYAFSQPITIADGARVVFGAGRVPGCGVDSDLALNPAALTNHGITGKGATLLLDGSARLTVRNASLTINRRVSTPATRGSEGIAIRTVNLGVSSPVLQVPRDSVQQGEYPCSESSPGICATPLVPDPSNLANSVDVAAHEVSIPTRPTPTILRYAGSTLAHNDNAVLVDFTGSTSQEQSSFETDGAVFVPNAQVLLRTAASGSAERLYSFLVNAGVVSSRLLLDARQLPLDPIENWYVGVQSQATQLRVALKAVASLDSGRTAVSRSVLETRADNSYAINSWTVDPGDSGASNPIVTTLPPVATSVLPTSPTTVPPSSLCPTITGWKAQYYNSPDLAGPVVLCRDEAAINVDWGAAGPGSPVGVDGFSARFTRTVTFAEGTYRFTISADDGYRLLIDGEVVAGCWCDSGLTTETLDIDIAAGGHSVVLEYRDVAGDASVALAWGVAPPPTTTTQATTTTSSSTTTTSTTLPPPGTCPTSVNGWTGEYYASIDLSGTRALCRDDADLNFWWGYGSPGASVPVDRFSARWTRTIDAVPGRYRLNVASDDGIRVWLDGQLVIDRWVDQGYTQNHVDLTVSGGQRTIVVEYYENGGEAGVALWWEPLVATCPTATGTNWVGEYFASMNLSGHRVVCRLDPVLGFAWGYGTPDPMVPTDFFSARWTRTADFVAGTHRFEINSDDGVRLYIDGNLVKADWTGGPTRYNWVDVPLTAGSHTITLEYFENNGPANVDLSWKQVGCPTVNGWSGQYYPNDNLTGDWVLCRDDASPNFDWGTGSPGPGVPNDNFSVRWTRTETFAAGRYRFDLGADNGTRLYIDGNLVRDFWGPTAGYQTTFAEVDLTAGSHTIVYEFREIAGSARSALGWALTPCQGLTGWRGEYYNNTSFSGSPTACRGDAAINFSWSSAPISGMPSDNFSVRWTKTITSTGGLYRFRTDIDDGYRLYVDGTLVADHGSAVIETVDVVLSPGPHLITLEMWEFTNTARARLAWTPVGRYVRVQLATQDYLHMAEVRVNGVNGTGGQAQRAQGRPAIQSSTHQTAAASRAVDGNTNGTYGSGSVQHTNFDWNAWWQVDLGATFGVNTVEVWNRTDCCGSRLSNYTVFVSPTDMSSQTYAQLLANPDVAKITSTVAPAPNRVHTFTRNG